MNKVSASAKKMILLRPVLEPVQLMATGDIMILVAAMDMGCDYSKTHCFNGYVCWQ